MQSWLVSFEVAFEFGQRVERLPRKPGDPSLGDGMDRHGVEEMQLFPPAPQGRDEIRRFQQAQMFRDRLTRHREPLAEFAERLSVPRTATVEQGPAACVGERVKNGVLVHARQYATQWLRVKR